MLHIYVFFRYFVDVDLISLKLFSILNLTYKTQISHSLVIGVENLVNISIFLLTNKKITKIN